MDATRATRATSALFWILIAFTVASRASAQQAVDGTSGTSINNDITKPIHRLDYFLEYMQATGGVQTLTPKIRYERPFDLNDSWKIALRVRIFGR